jgi:putative CocE/NonD family hydrolase
MRPRTRLVASLATLGLAAGGLAGTSPATAAAPAPPTVASPATGTMHWSPRPEQYAGTVSRKDLAIPMSDGVVLRGDLTLPADADGNAAPGRFPVVVTITAYNKTVIAGGFGSTLAGADPAYLVKRGYAQLTVDARGTGSSAGIWEAFSPRENKDAGEVLTWAHQQPWSNGSTAMTGASYMGISQLFAAAARPAGLKAIFPQVPAADVYRDVVASGGQLDVGFIPLWLGLVTATGLIPPATAGSDPQSAFEMYADHLAGLGTFTAPLLADAVLGGDHAYDGQFYADRSPINVLSKVDVPTFLISGEFDLFQRGTPLDFENLQRRGVPARIIIGPWDHLQGSSGADVGLAGYGSLAELQLRWFDHYVLGLADPALDTDIPPVTYYEQGTSTWQHTRSWVGSDRKAVSFRLSGSATPLLDLTKGALTQGPVTAGTSTVLPVPVSGLCTRSMNQWTAGIVNLFPFPNPCLLDNTLNDLTGVVFDSAPVTTPVSFQGPVNARLYVSSTTGDGMLSVSIEDVAPGGAVTRLSGGWQVISFGQEDASRTRYLDGKVLQPYYPYTQASRKPLTPGAVAPVDVEIFPTGASIQPGHKLRLAVQAFDIPHLAPPLPDLPGVLTALTLHNSAAYPSELTLPGVVPAGTTTGSTFGPSPAARVASRATVRLAHRPGHVGRRNAVTIVVTRGSSAATGTVTAYVDGRLLRSTTLSGGRVVVRIPKRFQKHAGSHRLRVVYAGTATTAPTSVATTWRVRR